MGVTGVGVTAPAALARYRAQWWIAGGWAVDLCLGRETRPHGDLDVVALRRDQRVLARALAGADVRVVENGPLHPWDGEPVPRSIHQLRVDGEFDVLLDEADGERWIYRRDPRVSRPLVEIGRRSRDGVPFLAPEVVLLFKAKAPAPKDEADFALLEPRLDAAARTWLAGAIALVHPGHPWLERLA